MTLPASSSLKALSVDAGDGLRLHVWSEGAGPAVLLLHGFTGSSETWRPLGSALRSRHTVIAVDLPGHGRSSAPQDPARYAVPRFANDLVRVLDAMQVDRVTVVGYSLGGRVALRFALDHVARVNGVILVSTSPGIENPAERAARVAADAELAESVERDGVTAFVDRWERLPLWASQSSLSQESRDRLRALRLAQSPLGLAGSLRGAGAGMDAPVIDRLPDLRAPARLIAGALDARYVAAATRMAALMPRADVVVVPEAGHAVHLENPRAFEKAILEFLARE